MIRLFQGNTDPSLSDVISVDGAPVDLTGATVHFRMRAAGAKTTTVDAVATITQSGTSPNFVNEGGVRYDWALNDLSTVGGYRGWWHVIYGDGHTQDTPEFDLVVLPHAATDRDLCTVFDVRLAMGLATSSTGQDDMIQEYISEATAVIEATYSRQFSPETDGAGNVLTGVTKRFRVVNRRVDFYPYDLRNLTSVVLHPDQQNLTLDTTIDVEMSPFQKPDGVWTTMKISPWLPYVSPHSMRYGHPYADVKGDWGFPSVPVPVKRAAVICVRSWLRRDLATFSGVYASAPQGDAYPKPEGTYSVPFAAQKLLARYERWAGVV